MMLEIQYWLFIKLINELDNNYAQRSNANADWGRGSAGHGLIERFIDDTRLIEAKLIDASQRDLNRYERLFFDKFYKFGPLAIAEQRIILQLLEKLCKQGIQRLMTSEDEDMRMQLDYETQEMTKLKSWLSAAIGTPKSFSARPPPAPISDQDADQG